MQKKTIYSISFASIALAVFLAGIVWFLAYLHRDFTTANATVHFLIENRLAFSIGAIILSAISGYALALYTATQLGDKEEQTTHLRFLLQKFLRVEEQQVIDELLRKNETLQSELSRNTELTRVQVHRILKKLSDQELITLTPHGKTHKITLDSSVRALLEEPKH